MIAAVTFKGVVDGKERTFAKGSPITKDEAKQMGLASKSHLTEKGPKNGS